MSQYDYEISKEIAAQGYPFYAIIMAAMRQADDSNLEKLKSSFPDIWDELGLRFSAPGGKLQTDLNTK